MRWVNVYRHNTFFRKIELAVTITELMQGLLGRTSAGRGLFLMGTSQIHMVGMKFPIDVVYLNKEGFIIGLEEALPPNSYGEYFKGAAHVIEFSSGTIQDYQIKVGERWFWSIEE
ncbi:DUF192 domain-containing protein [Risungbinella massiliensis]|uniref:DUF192 domain-containing protein n=1 Tax=Risungbinella massiliensis TaxID=1329796 RepID=UPI00069B6519|nr:DUF192 domain-containing protein [Risungbinella massiliensis]